MVILDMSLLDAVVLVAILLEGVLFFLARKAHLPPNGYKLLGLTALLIGLPVVVWLGITMGALAWHADWRTAAKHALLGYVAGTATWLSWLESKPF